MHCESSGLPVCIYDIEVPSADGKVSSILSKYKGKVTLLFNVAAGCGNIPQHMIIEELNQLYKNEPDFNIVAITVDDFVCHSYPEFAEGLQPYIEKNKLQLTPGQVAEKYAKDNFNVTYEFSALTNGRYDKHEYSTSFVPGKIKQQEMHRLWFFLTDAYLADVDEFGTPYHDEYIPWSDTFHVSPPDGKKGFTPLTGNFEKFLISRSGRKLKRYPNGFLLGERDEFNRPYEWFNESSSCSTDPSFRPDYTPNHQKRDEGPENNGPFPTEFQRRGISMSLKKICSDIDQYLLEKLE